MKIFHNYEQQQSIKNKSENYGKIMPLNTAYKILATFINNRLKERMKETIGKHQ